MVVVLIALWAFPRLKKARPEKSAGSILPATGQTEIWSEFDDGYYRTGRKLRFRDLGNGTVSDLNTGLMWVKSGYADIDVSPPVPYQSEGPWRKYFWNQALLYCERLQFAGYSDWRLPNYKELISILDLSRMDPAVDQTYFPGTRSDFYWSSTTFVSQTYHGWYIYFNLGYANHINKDNYFYIRPVRNLIPDDPLE